LLDFAAERYYRGLGRQADRIYEIIAGIKERAKLNPDRKFEDVIQDHLDELFMKTSTSSRRRDPIYDPSLMKKIITYYTWILNKSDALDFTDILIKGLDVLRKTPWARELGGLKHVLVDEL
jgi:hypothetical protein